MDGRAVVVANEMLRSLILMSATMSSLYTHAFSHQAAFRRLSFQHGFKRAAYPLQRTPFPSPLRTRHFSHHVTPSRVAATLGTGIAGAGLGLSFYANFRKLNCERESLLILFKECLAENWK
jgi:hypothetical protein